MDSLRAITSIAQAIQFSVAPVFLLAGIGAILNVLAGRLARIIDRVRVVETHLESATDSNHARQVTELRLLDRRMTIINAALTLCVASAIAICMVVALLFTAEIRGLNIGITVAIAFIVAMALLMVGLILFLVEVRISLRSLRVRAELLEHAGPEPDRA